MNVLLASHSLGRVLGIDVRVTYTFYLLFGVLVLSQLLSAPPAMALLFAVLMVAYFGCIFLHEMGHSLAAFKEGVSVRAIYLHPLGGLARLEGRLPGPTAEIVVALAGPLVSLVLAALFFLPMFLLYGATPQHSLPGLALWMLFLGNMIPALFNLLPFFPMDGGRVVTAALVMKYGVARAVRLSGSVARVGFIGMGVVGLLLLVGGRGYNGFVLILMAAFLYSLGRPELQARQHAESYAGGTAYEPWRAPDSWRGGTVPSEPEPPADRPGWLGRKLADLRRRRADARRAADQETRQAVDEVLRKVKAEGVGALTPKERDLLNRASRDFRDRQG
jgi:stage IV sporulation protein FB